MTVVDCQKNEKQNLVFNPQEMQPSSSESDSESDGNSVDVSGDYVLFRDTLVTFVRNHEAFHKNHEKYCASVLKIAQRWDDVLNKRTK